MAHPYTPPPTTSPKTDKFKSTFKIPAQDSYFYSTPNSPSQQVAVVPIPSRKTPSPSGRKTPNPIYFSPTNPVPSPHNVARPKPRLGFRKRILAKISSWIRKIYLWAKGNPIKAGLITFAPVLALAGATRAFHSLGKLLGKGKTEADKVVKESRKSAKEGKKAKQEGKKVWGWGLDNFVDFNGSKGGPLDGILKILQMWVNHICRLSPSMVPRTMAIILELYFLDIEKSL